MSTRLYVEGGGDRNPSKTKCRQAFQAFLLNAGLEGRLPRIFASGGRQQAYDDFRIALGASRDDDRVVLLVDSEGPVGMDAGPWQHLKDRDGWDRPDGADDDHIHLMVQCMEAWFLADRPHWPDTSEMASTRTLSPVERMSRRSRSRTSNAG